MPIRQIYCIKGKSEIAEVSLTSSQEKEQINPQLLSEKKQNNLHCEKEVLLFDKKKTNRNKLHKHCQSNVRHSCAENGKNKYTGTTNIIILYLCFLTILVFFLSYFLPILFLNISHSQLVKSRISKSQQSFYITNLSFSIDTSKLSKIIINHGHHLRQYNSLRHMFKAISLSQPSRK